MLVLDREEYERASVISLRRFLERVLRRICRLMIPQSIKEEILKRRPNCRSLSMF